MAESLDPPPLRRAGYIEFPVLHVRGGTSTGLVISASGATRPALREELLRHLMGLPLEGTRAGNKQITGLGRIVPTGNKAFFARDTTRGGPDRQHICAARGRQAAVDWSVNCGNMTAALPLWAIDTARCCRAKLNGDGSRDLQHQHQVTTDARLRRDSDGFSPAQIPGVDGAFPGVDLFLANPVGAKTGKAVADGSRCRRHRRLCGVVRRCRGADGDRARG